MRRQIALPIVATFSLAIATFALTLSASTPARAFGTHHAFCLTGQEWPGLSNCTFDSYAQCQASSSGRALTCIANPYFAGQSDDPYAYQNQSARPDAGLFTRLLPAALRCAAPASRSSPPACSSRACRRTRRPTIQLSRLHADLRPGRLFRLPLHFARTVQISRRRPLRELRREPVLSAEEVKGSPAAEAGRLGVLPCRDLPTLTPLRA